VVVVQVQVKEQALEEATAAIQHSQAEQQQ
jgi:hypothetical protein